MEPTATMSAAPLRTHEHESVEVRTRRLAAARRYAPAFGIATECGMARSRSEETVRTLLKIHADVCAGAASG